MEAVRFLTKELDSLSTVTAGVFEEVLLVPRSEV